MDSSNLGGRSKEEWRVSVIPSRVVNPGPLLGGDKSSFSSRHTCPSHVGFPRSAPPRWPPRGPNRVALLSAYNNRSPMAIKSMHPLAVNWTGQLVLGRLFGLESVNGGVKQSWNLGRNYSDDILLSAELGQSIFVYKSRFPNYKSYSQCRMICSRDQSTKL